MTWFWSAVLALACLPALAQRSTNQSERDHTVSVWLLGLLVVGGGYLITTTLWFLTPLAWWFAWVWPRHPTPERLVPALVRWAAVGATWALAGAVPRDLVLTATLGWVGWQSLATALVVAQKVQAPRWYSPVPGWMGQRTYAAFGIALAVPFAPWWALPVLAVGLWCTGPSAFVVLGLAVALPMQYPWLGVHMLTYAGIGVTAVVLAELTVWPVWLAQGKPRHARPRTLWAYTVQRGPTRCLLDHLTPRGSSLDSVWTRTAKYGLILRHVTLWGRGPGSMGPALSRWCTVTGVRFALGDAHCDPLQLAYEYGVAGIVALCCFTFQIVPHVRLGDPWSAAVVLGAILMLGSFAGRVPAIGLVWLVCCRMVVG